MRTLIFLLVTIPLAAQDPQPGAEQKKTAPHAAPKNLKLLKPEEVRPMMGAFRVALGGQCTTCHVQGDFASDDKPEKQTARMMIVMTRDINAKFTDGEQHVTCYTCHRGEEHPKMKADAAPAAPAN
ncbi:MAG: c-type cytochrome [Acidobacteriota bacterium]|nr:c-type cytochrome [Acidobacteriota bacterium]